MRCVGVGKCRHSRRRGDVPVLHGHPRGGALHPRPEPAAVRDARGTRRLPGHRRLAVHRGPRRPRPVPGLQGLQEGLPGRGRHGHHEGRVPGPPLRRAAPPAGALLDGLAARGGPARLPGPAAGQRAHPGTRPARRRSPRRAASTGTAGSRCSPARPCKPGTPGAIPARPGCAARSCCGRTPSPTTSPPAIGQAAVEVLEAAGWRVIVPGPAAVLRPDLDLHRPAGHRPAGAAAHRRRPRARICSGAPRSSGWSRAAPRSSGPTPAS